MSCLLFFLIGVIGVIRGSLLCSLVGWPGPRRSSIILPTTIKDFPVRLEAFLQEKLNQPVHLCGARQLTGGASRDTWTVVG